MKRFLSTIIIIAGVASTAAAQQPTPLSLNDCMEYTMKHNYAMKNADLDVQIQQAQVEQQLSASYPHINGKVEFDDFNVPQRSFIDASSFSPSVPKGTIEPISFTLPYAASAGITTSQVLFDGSVFVAVKARKTVVDLARRNKDVTEEGLRYNVYLAYNTLVIARKQFGILTDNLAYLRSMLKDLEATNKSGFTEKVDVERTTVQVNNLMNDSISTDNNLLVAERALKFQMGMEINTPILLTDTLITQDLKDVESLINGDVDYKRIPTYNLLETSLKANEYNVERYKMSALPSLSAFWAQGSNYGAINAKDMFVFNRYWASSTIGVQLNMPIFNGFLRVKQLKEANLNVDKAKNNMANWKLAQDFMTIGAKTKLKNAYVILQSQKRNIELASDVLDLARRKYKAGVGSNLEVTQAQADLLKADSGYFSAQLDILNAAAELKKELGLLK